MMRLYTLEELSFRDAWLTVGVFDGVHRGHQEIIRQLVEGARRSGSPAVVVTFWPHPATVLGTGHMRCLTTPDERAELLMGLGVNTVVNQVFDRHLAATPALEFVSRLKQHLGFRHLLIGYDFALGKGREGNAARLTEIGRELDYAVEVIPALGDESGVISSTEIRKLVATGGVAEAAKLLGHNFTLHGPVVHGDGRGRGLGFPTANIDVAPEKILPSNGVYACRAVIAERAYMAAVNVGVRPQFHTEPSLPLVEAYVLDLDLPLYGLDLRLEFVARLRDEVKFASVEALIEQIQRDVDRVRDLLFSS
jgi:riboflavin kinase / FMN adenylyltransferase